jgi:hypothetical protein
MSDAATIRPVEAAGIALLEMFHSRGSQRNKKVRSSMRGSPELLTWRCRLELLESASPIAFADHPQFSKKQSVFQIGTKSRFWRLLPLNI